MKIVNYDPRAFPFARMVEEFLNVRSLMHVHLLCPIRELLVVGKDQETPIHDAFYNRMHEMLPLYRAFVREVVAPHVPGTGDLVYQTKPTFRVAVPGNLAVGEFHVDSKYGHQPRELNFWVPLTQAFGSSTIQIESSPGANDHKPVRLIPGEVLVFDGAKLSHGNVPNELGISRVSFDLRCLRMSDYDESLGTASHNTGKRFVIGGYYERMNDA